MAAENASDKTIVEVMPCGDVTNTANSPGSPKRASDGSKLDSHADGFGVNQILKKEDDIVKPQLDAEDTSNVQNTILEGFGAQIHRGINAKAWDERTLALAAVRTKCENKNIPGGVSNETFLDACCKFLIACIQDKVMPVYFDGLDLMKYMFGEFFANFPEATEVVRDNLEHMLPLLIAKSADRNARSIEATRLTLIFLARCACVGSQPVMAHIFSPVQNHKEVAAIRGRLDLINNLIDEFGFGKAGTITMQLVMGFVRPHLDATDEKVRRAAVEVTVNCYKHKGDRTLKYVTNVKPALLKLLHQRFEELGKPSKGSRKNAKSAQGLPAVRGKPRVKAPPKRDTTSQPSMGAGANQSFFNREPVIGREDAPRGNDRTEDLNNVLKDCSQLFSMGNTMTMSPLSNTAVGPLSRENGPFEQSYFQPQHDPNFIGSPHEGLRLPGSMGAQMDDHLDLDADLMDEIESY